MEKPRIPQTATLEGSSRDRVLVVEDEPALRRAFARMLEGVGFSVQQAGDGQQAIEALAAGAFDVVLTDVGMPGMDGMQLLRVVRERDLDVPVILISGHPSIESAVSAVEYGALQYLIKPVDSRSLIEAVGRAAKLGRIATLKREAARLGQGDWLLGDRVAMDTSLKSGLDTLWIAYQPIVDWNEKRTVAFEALVRTNEPTLPNPGVLFAVAERLGRVHEIGRRIRDAIARDLAEQPPLADIFINVHAHDLLDETLFSPDSPLAAFASQIVLEVTERAALDESVGIPQRVSRLRELGYRVAIDDLGAGYAGLTYFAQLTPDVVKIDISLTVLCKDLGMHVVAEGVETTEERDAVVAFGCSLLQGYLFARPGRPFPEVTW
jgi:EAL domain-containing protein (putative c-di-GMP-specific phosphodiesterase class I)/CheY-like chemotaxis protein